MLSSSSFLPPSEPEPSKYFDKRGRHEYIDPEFLMAEQCLGTLVGDKSENPIKFC